MALSGVARDKAVNQRADFDAPAQIVRQTAFRECKRPTLSDVQLDLEVNVAAESGSVVLGGVSHEPSSPEPNDSLMSV